MPGRFLLWVVILIGFAGHVHGAIDIRLAPRPGMAAPTDGVLVLRRIPDARLATDKPAEREVPIAGPVIRIDDAPETRWEVSLRSKGFWAAPVVVTFSPSEQVRPVDLPIWRTTTISGVVRPAVNEKLPQSLSVIAESPPQPAKTPEIMRGTRFPCALSAEGAWACTVPAAHLDIVLRIEGYAPIYQWGLVLNPDEPRDLGEIRLQKGASLTVWLDTQSLKTLKEPADALLTRLVASVPSQTTARLSVPVAEGQFNARGMVQLVSLPAGTYVLTVKAKGFAPARAFPIEIFAGKETALRKPITLHPPVVIRISVRPATDAQAQPWTVDVRRVNDFGSGIDVDPAVSGPISGDGMIEVKDQAPGSFLVTLSDHAGNVFMRRDLDLRDGTDANVTLDVPLVRVHGKVLLGEHPFPATLWFGGRNAQVSVKLSTNDEGEFEGTLPNRGQWTVALTGQKKNLDTVVSVVVGEDDVVVRIPETIVSGRVVDPAGGPIDQVEVTANAAGRPVTMRPRQDGSFAFYGLPEVTVLLRADDLRTGRSSKAVQASVKAGEPVERVELRLEPDREVNGRIMSRGIPVIGAQVTIVALMEPSSPTVRGVSDEAGKFQFRVPSIAQRAWVIVGAPGKTLQNYEVVLNSGPVVLELEPIGGTVVLAWPKGNLPVVLRGGTPLPLPNLTGWARAQGEMLTGEQLRIPNLAPGSYRFCTMVPVVRSPNANAETVCKDGILPPAGVLNINLGSS